MYWLSVGTDVEAEDQFILSLLIRFFCSGLGDYIIDGPSPAAAHTAPFLHWYNFFSDDHYESQGHYDYSVHESSVGRACAAEIIAFPYESLTGITMRGTYSGFFIHNCSFTCTLGKTGVVYGESGPNSPGSPNCPPAVQ